MTIRAPFPWFGGKRRVASIVWDLFGADVANYVEPFAGSLAVLLGRPGQPKTETVNDLDAYVANFWRATQADPDLVAQWADWPVSETDLHARHRWLVDQLAAGFRERMLCDPEYYDPQVAGWWVWGVSQWIGSGWCSADNDWKRFGGHSTGRGIHCGKVNLGSRGTGVHRKRVRLDRGGRGVTRQLPCLHGDSGDSGATGRGIHASALERRLGSLGRRAAIESWMRALADRLRSVRVCCGDWKRILTRSPTTCIGTTAVFLDPPYGEETERTARIYAQDSGTVAGEVLSWCVAHGANPQMRIILCGYAGEHDALEGMGWSVVEWEASGGYGSRTEKGRARAKLERLWCSPACLRPAEEPEQHTIEGITA